MKNKACRFCGSELRHIFCDLGVTPLANSYIQERNLDNREVYYPLRAYVCESCYLVQLSETCNPKDIFSEYDYFSSYSRSWLNHAKAYRDEVVRRFDLNSESLVVEIGSNDGYLLQYFKQSSIPVLGIEPATNIAKQAIVSGVATLNQFFTKKLAKEL